MIALEPRDRARLDRFIGLLLFPALGPDEDEWTHKGVARALLASKVRWTPADLAFLRAMACARLSSADKMARLMGLFHDARERSA